MLGSASLAQVVWQAIQVVIGGPQAVTGLAFLGARFPGRWFQIHTGLHYTRHSHCDPATGRYIQPTRWAFFMGRPLTTMRAIYLDVC